MKTREIQEIQNKAIEVYGVEKQILVCIEELSELIKAITKVERYIEDTDLVEKEHMIENVVEEIADVKIIIEYLKIIYGIEESEIEEWVENKIQRTKKLIDEVEHEKN